MDAVSTRHAMSRNISNLMNRFPFERNTLRRPKMNKLRGTEIELDATKTKTFRDHIALLADCRQAPFEESHRVLYAKLNSKTLTRWAKRSRGFQTRGIPGKAPDGVKDTADGCPNMNLRPQNPVDTTVEGHLNMQGRP